MRLLLLSNSTNAGEGYLEYPMPQIIAFLGNKTTKCLFIPYAAVTFSFDEYEDKVKKKFKEIGHDVVSIHTLSSPIKAVESAEVIVIGGGNTFHLLKMLQQTNIIEAIKSRVANGIPYIGWSAGANIACPTICTTNDMPIVETSGFKGLNLIPFQINPHYNDVVLPGHAGETRDQRIAEFLAANPLITVVGLREGTMLKYEQNTLALIGDKATKIFNYNKLPYDLGKESSFNFLLEKM